MNWDADFAGLPPIELPDGRKLETLAECAAYILELPKRQQEEARWQQVTAQLLKAAERGGGRRFIARVAFSNTLHGVSGVEAPAAPRHKNAGIEGEARCEEATMTVWINVDASKRVGHPEHLKVLPIPNLPTSAFVRHNKEAAN